jgi:hypothetical protein
MKDFTLSIFSELLKKLKTCNYQFVTFAEHLKQQKKCTAAILRHDIDKLPLNALTLARMENASGIRGTYYFRIIPGVFNKDIIDKIAGLGHEIGYHYETMDTSKGNIDKAYDEFCRNLEKFRKIHPVETICMHGSPLSKYDNKKIWEKYDYRKLGIIGEPYFDTDFNEFAYFTDTGRRWNAVNVSVRDRVESKYNFNFRSTFELIRAVESLPERIMLTIHPQRWFTPGAGWAVELFNQNAKNIIKYFISRKRSVIEK